MAAFLDPGMFADWAGKPAWASNPVAAALLTVVEEWIRDRKPDLDDDDPAAKVVVFEVTREAMEFGKYSGLSSFQMTTAHSTRAGTIRWREIEKFITDRHKRMLGISVQATPRARFLECDY